MIHRRRWVALLLLTVITFSSITVLAVSGETGQTPQLTETEPSAETEDPPEQTEPTEPAEEPAEAPGPTIYLNGELMDFANPARLVGGTTFVPFGNFCAFMDCTVAFKDNQFTVFKEDLLTMKISIDSDLMCANDRYFYISAPLQFIEGVAMIPVRAMAKVFALDVAWDSANSAVLLSGEGVLAKADDFYDADDLLWLSRIIHAESRGEPFEGQIAVGNVIINRTLASNFPNTIKDVIFDRKNGVQFTPTRSGSIYNTPKEQCVIAAKLVLEGYKAIEDAIYFLSTKSKAGWVARNCTLVTQIGNHNFFS